MRGAGKKAPPRRKGRPRRAGRRARRVGEGTRRRSLGGSVAEREPTGFARSWNGLASASLAQGNPGAGHESQERLSSFNRMLVRARRTTPHARWESLSRHSRSQAVQRSLYLDLPCSVFGVCGMPQTVRIGPDVKRRTMDIPLEQGMAVRCVMCLGLYRAHDGLGAMCPGCRVEAGRLAAVGDPRRAMA